MWAFSFLIACEPLANEPVVFSETTPSLAGLAIKLDCYFTIEEVQDDPVHWGKPHRFYMQTFHLPRDLENLDDLVTALNRKLVRGRAYRVNKRSRVIHIIDKALLNEPDYALNKALSINFVGSPSGLLDELERQQTSVRRPKGGVLGFGIRHGDSDTPIEVMRRDSAIRDVLTSGLPLSSYSRLLWLADTRPNLSETSVRFKGKKRGHVSTDVARTPGLIDFARGETAYYANQGKLGANQAARQFLAESMKKSEPLQARWAMFFLGLQKDREAIPLLVRHLDYLYTPTGVVEEAYPAVKALTLMGNASTPAVIDEIEKADDELRIKLFTTVLKNVETAAGAKEILARRVRIADDPQARARFQKAASLLEDGPAHRLETDRGR